MTTTDNIAHFAVRPAHGVNFLPGLRGLLRPWAHRTEPIRPGLPGRLTSMLSPHFINNLLPFVTLPYLVKTLGFEAYGKSD